MTDASTAQGRQPIDTQTWMRAAGAGDASLVQSLLAAGADVNATLDGGETALIRATSKGHLHIVQLLVEAGADVNAEREDGFTALSLAILFGYADIVHALLAAGADASAKGRLGTTAENWARFNGFTEIVDLLRNADSIRAQGDGPSRATTGRKRADAPLLFPTEGPFNPVVPLSEINEPPEAFVGAPNGGPPASRPVEADESAEVEWGHVERGEVERDARSVRATKEHEEVTLVPARTRPSTSAPRPFAARLKGAWRSWPVTVAALALIFIVGLIADAQWKRFRLSADTQQTAPPAPDSSASADAGTQAPAPAPAAADAQTAPQVSESSVAAAPDSRDVASAPVINSDETGPKAERSERDESTSGSKSSAPASSESRGARKTEAATRREAADAASEARRSRPPITAGRKNTGDARGEVRTVRRARQADARASASPSREDSLPVFSPAARPGKKKVIQWP